MGIHFMENFDIAETASANILAALNAKGADFRNQTVSGYSSALALSTYTENGVTRSTIRDVRAASANAFTFLKFPVPTSKVYYATFRLRWANASLPDGGIKLYVGHVDSAASMNNNNFFGIAQAFGAKWRFYNTNNSTTPASSTVFYEFGFNDWITIEIARAADGKIRMWCNDILLYDPARTIATSAIADNYIYIGRCQIAGGTGGVAFPGWEFSDVIVVDPATTGLQYRPGKSARVLAGQYASDVVAQWQADPSATLPHNQIMSAFHSPPVAANILTTQTQGAREQYQLSPLSTAFGNIIQAVKLEPQVMNTGAAQHTLAVEVDTGAGLTEVAALNLAAGVAMASVPVYLYKKPDGSLWTPADIGSLKAGFSAKS